MISLSPVRLLTTAAQNNYLKSNMKFYALFAAMLLSGSIAFAQNDDPTIMTINGQPVSRSEFEYSYNKNNSEGVIDKKTVNEYVDLFVNYKLKVLAALGCPYRYYGFFQDRSSCSIVTSRYVRR